MALILRILAKQDIKTIVVDNVILLFYDIIIDSQKGGLIMATTTISPKYQVVIPKDVREKLHLKSGQKMVVVTKGGIVYFIPEKPLETFRGFLKGMDTRGIREDEER